MEVSRSSIDIHLITKHSRDMRSVDPSVRIYALIRDLAKAQSASTLSMQVIKDLVNVKGFSDKELQQCLIFFDDLNVWSVSNDGVSLTLIN
jgi:hypothetical protein